MGNACNEPPMPDSTCIPLPITQQPASPSMQNSYILAQMRSLPPVSKHILTKMDELGSFQGKDFMALGPIYQMKNRAVYQGQLKDGKLAGPGRIFISDGSVIQSIFDNGQPKGQTRIFKSNGDYFVGTISNGTEKEYGLVFEKGIKYEGDLLNQRPHGYGHETCKNYTYSGSYENGKKINGRLEWNFDNPKAKQLYEGAFENNLFQGPGTLIKSDGKYEGYFEQGAKSGYGVFEDGEGRKYEGSFKKNKQEGEGKLYDKDGTIISQGTWANGKLIKKQQNTHSL